MTAHSPQFEAMSRGARMLRTALGPAIAAFLEDPAIVEIMLNPDGRLWIDRLSNGLAETGEQLSPEDGKRIIRLVAHHDGAEVHPGAPRVSAELPGTGERFEGLLPPIVAAPAFAIRKPAVAIFGLDDYAAVKIMTRDQAAFLRQSIEQRHNILVAGGTSTGKTTLVNALLAEVAKTSDRVVLIEDTRELQCKARNLVALRTKDGAASLSELVRVAGVAKAGDYKLVSASKPCPSGDRRQCIVVEQARLCRVCEVRRSLPLLSGLSTLLSSAP